MQSNTKKKITPVVVAILVVLYIGPIVAAAVYVCAAFSGLPGAEEVSGLIAFVMLYALTGGAVIVGVLTALAQRLREIDGGEEDEAKKY